MVVIRFEVLMAVGFRLRPSRLWYRAVLWINTSTPDTPPPSLGKQWFRIRRRRQWPSEIQVSNCRTAFNSRSSGVG
jgi:hypothetical protein